MPARITRAAGCIPGLFDIEILATGEMLCDLTTNQVSYVIATRGLIPA